MSGPKPTAECEVCNGPVSTFIAYNHENGTQTERILREDWKASVDAHHEYEASLRAEVERAGALIEEVVVRFGEHADVREGVAAWHLYASELKPWLDDNRPGWRDRVAALDRKERK